MFDVPNDVVNAKETACLNLPVKVIKKQCLLERTHTLILEALNKVCLKIV